MTEVMPQRLVLSHGAVDAPTFAERVAAAAAAGNVGIAAEFPRHRQFLAAGETIESMRTATAQHGVRVDELWSLFDILNPAIEAKNAAFAERVYTVAVELGAKLIGVLGGPMGSALPDAQTAAEVFARHCDRAARHGLRLALESSAISHMPDFRFAADVVGHANRENGGLVLDVWHFYRGPADFDALERLDGRRVFVIQLNDGTLAPRFPNPEDEVHRFRFLPGEGEFDLRRWVRILDRIAPQASWSIEVACERIRAMPPREAAVESARVTRALLERVRGG
jgi:sugar phosphate isomerase/epimerase